MARARRDDRLLLLVATAGVVVAGLLVAAIMLLALNRGDSVTDEVRPINVGRENEVRQNIEEEGSVIFADPFGGERAFYLTVEDGTVVALSIQLPDDPQCVVRKTVRGDTDVYRDCDGNDLETTDLARYRVTIEEGDPAEDGDGAVLVDILTLDPPPT